MVQSNRVSFKSPANFIQIHGSSYAFPVYIKFFFTSLLRNIKIELNMRKGRQGMSLHMQGVFCLYTDKKYFVD